MGLCSSASAALKQPPAPKPAEETGRGEPSEEDKTKVHPASEPIERPDPPAIEEPEKSAAHVRAADPATPDPAVVAREQKEEEAKVMLLVMKNRADEDRRQALIAEEEAALLAERERPVRAYLEKKRLGLFDTEASRRLLERCMDGDASEVLRAIGEGADINYRDPEWGWTGLILSCTYGHLGCVEVLLAVDGAIANENIKDNYGCTALLAAAAASRPDIVQALVDGRRGRIDLEAKDNKGKTALLVAQARSCFEEPRYPSTLSLLQIAGAKH